LNEDFLDLISEFNRADVRYLLVGGYAVGIHGHPRATKDLDLWVAATPDNAPRVIAALRAFGAPLASLQESDLATPGTGFMMGLPPRRIDIVTTVDGLAFDDAWPGAMDVEVGGGVTCKVIGLQDLLINKAAAGRPQDLADVAALRRIAGLK
jgi:hypothetical protein